MRKMRFLTTDYNIFRISELYSAYKKKVIQSGPAVLQKVFGVCSFFFAFRQINLLAIE